VFYVIEIHFCVKYFKSLKMTLFNNQHFTAYFIRDGHHNFNQSDKPFTARIYSLRYFSTPIKHGRIWGVGGFPGPSSPGESVPVIIA